MQTKYFTEKNMCSLLTLNAMTVNSWLFSHHQFAIYLRLFRETLTHMLINTPTVILKSLHTS